MQQIVAESGIILLRSVLLERHGSNFVFRYQGSWLVRYYSSVLYLLPIISIELSHWLADVAGVLSLINTGWLMWRVFFHSSTSESGDILVC